VAIRRLTARTSSKRWTPSCTALRTAPAIAVRGLLEEQGGAIPSCPKRAVETLLGEVLGLVTPGRLIAPENGLKLGYELLLIGSFGPIEIPSSLYSC